VTEEPLEPGILITCQNCSAQWIGYTRDGKLLPGMTWVRARRQNIQPAPAGAPAARP
jgi:hypothetical protein